MPPDGVESSLERVRRRLYAPQRVDDIAPAPLSARGPAPAEGWKHEPPPAPKAPERPKLSGAALFLIVSAGFFLIAGLAAALILFLGGRTVSTDNLNVSIEGSTAVGGGEAATFFVTIKNDNPLAATGVTISADFPEGTRDADDPTKPLTHYSEQLDDIPAGASASATIRGAFFGPENQKVAVPITVEYKTDNSSATFVKKKTHEFIISTSPIRVSVAGLSETASGQPLTLTATVRSNATANVDNVAVKVDYPFGFAPSATDPAPLAGSVFSLGSLAPGEEKKLKITGTLTGTNGDERIFKFTGGTLKTAESKELGVSYTTQAATVRLAKSFLAVSLALGRDEGDTIVIVGGEPVHGTLSWVNTLASSITDGQISVKLAGDALDPESVTATNGFYRSSDRTVLYNRDTELGLKNLQPGDTGNGTFTFSTKRGAAGLALRNPSVTITISVAGRRVGESGVPENLASTLTRTAKVATDLTLTSRAVHSAGLFTNSGPWPPEADKETTYTIIWTVANTVNSVANATVTATLPSYVRFTGQKQPAGIAYNETTREVTWTIGDLPAGTTREGSFQVGITPSVTQRGTAPTLVPGQSVTGYDRFIEQQVAGTAPQLDTEVKTDPAFQSGFGRVK